jgi:two-component sensor histidine kinase
MAEEGRELLAGEMSHRVKNLFAIAAALTQIASRSAATTEEMARDITQRLNALGQAHGDRIRVDVPEVLVGEASITTVALVIHELATNSIKYGSLSSTNGTVDISCSVEGRDAIIVWTEKGGPPLTVPRGQAGFGSKLVHASLSSQLGGCITFQWLAEGAIVTLRVNKALLGT